MTKVNVMSTGSNLASLPSSLIRQDISPWAITAHLSKVSRVDEKEYSLIDGKYGTALRQERNPSLTLLVCNIRCIPRFTGIGVAMTNANAI